MCVKTTHDNEMAALRGSALQAFGDMLRAGDYGAAIAFSDEHRGLIDQYVQVQMPSDMLPLAIEATRGKLGIHVQYVPA